MPRLRLRRDKRYYLVCNFTDVGFCTYQLAPEAEAQLERENLLFDGAEVPFNLVCALRDEKRLFTNQTGPTILPLVRCLDNWVQGGDLRKLDEALRQGQSGSENLNGCFSKDFLNWLSGLGEVRRLSDLAEISWPDFSRVADTHTNRLPDSLHSQLFRVYGILPIWRLARLVGLAALWLDSAGRDRPCPDGFPGTLIATLRAWSSGPKRKTRVDQNGPGLRLERGVAPQPTIVWCVDEQKVVAVFPRHPVLPGQTAEWAVQDEPWVGLPVWPGVEGNRIDETHSEPLGPAASFRVRYRLKGSPKTLVSGECRLPLPFVFSPFVLFHPDGKLVACDGYADPVPPGESYLVLVKDRKDVENRQDVEILDAITFPPIGWEGWSAFLVRLDPGADITPYTVVSDRETPSWRLSLPVEVPVHFGNVTPVFAGEAPRIYLSPESLFDNARLTLQHESGNGTTSHVLRLGQDTQLERDEGGSCYITLNADLARKAGRSRLTVRLPQAPLVSLLPIEWVQLGGECRPSYVPDPNHPAITSAVRFWSAAPPSAAPQTKIHSQGDGSWLACSADPVGSPGVRFHLPAVGVEVQVALPVTRVRRERPNGASPWQRPPLLSLELGDVGLEDRLRVQLKDCADLRDGQLLWRVVGARRSGRAVRRASAETRSWFRSTAGAMFLVSAQEVVFSCVLGVDGLMLLYFRARLVVLPLGCLKGQPLRWVNSSTRPLNTRCRGTLKKP